MLLEYLRVIICYHIDAAIDVKLFDRYIALSNEVRKIVYDV
jgi:hypothetical protein